MTTETDTGASVVCDYGMLRRNASAHVLMIPYPAQPHLVPMLDLAHKLTSCGGITVTFVSFQFLVDRLEGREELNDAVRLVGVPWDRPGFSPPAELPENPIVLRESLWLGYNLEPFLQKLLQDREVLGLQGPTCLVSDFIHWWTIDVASRLTVPRYVLVVNSACFAAVLLSCRENGPPNEDDSSTIQPLTSEPLPMACRNCPAFPKVYRSRWPKSLKQCAGLLLNTATALESQVIDYVHSLMPEHRPVLPVGPLALSLSPESTSKNVSMEGLRLSDDREVMQWLDRQPPLSVLYVSFGTTGLLQLGKRHMMELAKALEDSQQRFVWVLRSPNDVEADADFLPLGFEERVKGKGFLLRGWAPQLQILGHSSIGAFLSSCGWNSATESLSRGVPIIGWPSFADQPQTCRYMEGDLQVAIKLLQQEDYFVEAEEIKKAIMKVLQSEEGRAMRERAVTIKTNLVVALGPKGTSTQAVHAFADLLRYPPAFK